MTPSEDNCAEGISCAIPVYNEAGAVAETLRSVADVLSACGRPWQIIMVDDGSSDQSYEAAESSGVEATLIRHPVNRGYGAAIKTGFRKAAHPWILIIDADGTYPADEIPKLVRVLDDDETVEMVVGQRTQTLQTDGFFRLQGKAILRILSNFLSGSKIPDLNSGLRIMHISALERFAPLLPNGFSLTTSITLAMLCSGAAVRYVPIQYLHRQGQSKIRPVRDMYNFIVLIARTITYFNPLKVYLPLAVVLVGSSIAITIYSKYIVGQVMDVTALFLFIAGLQMLLIGVIADLVLKVAGMRRKE